MEQYQNAIILLGNIDAVPQVRNKGMLLISEEDHGPGTVKAFCVDKADGDEKFKIAIIATSTFKEEEMDIFDELDLFMVEIFGKQYFYNFVVSGDCVTIANCNLNITVPDLENNEVNEFFEALKSKEECHIGLKVIGINLPCDEDDFADILNGDIDDDEDDEEFQDPITDEDLADDDDEPDYRKEENFVTEEEPEKESEEEMKIESKIKDVSDNNEESVFIRGKQTIKDETVENTPASKPLFKEVRIAEEIDEPVVNKNNDRRDFNRNKKPNKNYTPNKSFINDKSFKGNKPKPKNDNPDNLPSTKGTSRFGGW